MLCSCASWNHAAEAFGCLSWSYAGAVHNRYPGSRADSSNSGVFECCCWNRPSSKDVPIRCTGQPCGQICDHGHIRRDKISAGAMLWESSERKGGRVSACKAIPPTSLSTRLACRTPWQCRPSCLNTKIQNDRIRPPASSVVVDSCTSWSV